jgi:3'-phosphoadenosine 5'-phosphosulfate sulfotransferase (PAPS reductase)/FAD synthetase
MEMPDLRSYDRIVVNTSGGKDSQAQTDLVCTLADKVGMLDRVVMAHANLGAMEWPGTEELAREHAAHYGVRFEAVTRPQGDLLSHVLKRRMWPSSKQRFCTSDHKRGQIATLFTRFTAEVGNGARILSCMGMRAQESPNRAKLPVFQVDRRNTNTKRGVDIWLPLKDWTVDQVWARNRAAGTRHHGAYDLGMKRLSCVLCIFANRDSLLIAGKHNTELLREYVRVEAEIGHDFRHNFKLADILAAVERGEVPAEAPDFVM